MPWLTLVALSASVVAAPGTRINIDFGMDGGAGSSSGSGLPFPHFWEATGWCPPGNKSADAIATYALEESSWQNHALVRAVPNGGLKYVRVHDLLYLLEAAPGTDPANASAIDFRFAKLDAVVDLIVREHGLTMGFELMGNPKVLRSRDGSGNQHPYPQAPGLFTDWTDAAQLVSWRAMVGAIAARYVKRYGVEEVRRWRWEGWNEPDHQCNASARMSADIVCNLEGWLGYFDACAQGLMDAVPPSAEGAAAAHMARAAGRAAAADGSLMWGGPGTGGSTLQTQYLHAMLKHVSAARARDAAAASGEGGAGAVPSTRLDFIAWHEKGVLPGACGPGKDSNTNRDIAISEAVLAAAPALVSTAGPGGRSAAVSLGNEEVDPAGGWSKVFKWRGDARYAAAATRDLAMHLHAVAANASLPVRWGYHANDNAFLNYGDAWFDQRTLTVRFFMNESEGRGGVTPVEVLRKPILNTMALLSLLGDMAVPPEQVHAAGVGTGPDLTNLQTPIGVIATTAVADDGRWEAAALLYNSNGTFDCTSACNATAQVSLGGLPPTAAAAAMEVAGAAGGLPRAPMLVEYAIDQVNGNPRAVWEAMGGASNPFPSAEQFAALRKAAELVVLRRTLLLPTPVAKATQLLVELPQPSLRLLHVCSPPAGGAGPAMVGGLQLHVTPTVSPPTVFVRWEDVTERCLETYEVLWRPSSAPAAVATRVNELDQLFSAFTHAQHNATGVAAGCYSVRAMDYWHAAGATSDEVCL